MNTSNGALEFQTYIDNQYLIRDAKEAENRIKGLSDSTAKETKKMESSFSDASKALATIGGTFALTMLGKQILDTTAKFEKFGIVLRNTLGTDVGNQALSMISEFAIKTPFQLDEITDSFIKMANQGFIPTQDEMTKLGDIASSTGKSFNQLSEALLDAQTNQFERLREFGITTSQTQDKVTFTFREQQTTVDKNNTSIRNYLLSLGDLKGIQGANALIAGSLTGKISNLSDSFDKMFNEIGKANSGVLYEGLNLTSSLIENYDSLGRIVLGLVATYGAYKTAVMAVTAIKDIEATQYSSIAMSIDKESGGYERSIALKFRLAQASALRAEAVYKETASLSANANAEVAVLRTEVSALAQKKALAIQNAKDASLKLNQAKINAQLALEEEAISSKNINAKIREASAKKVVTTQNQLESASESAVIARKNASAVSSEFNAKKTLLETTAKQASTLSNNTNSASTTLNTALKNLDTVATTRLTLAESYKIGITRALTLAQNTLNASMLANPYVAVAVTVAGLATAVYLLSQQTSVAERAEKTFREEQDKFNETLDKTKQKTSELNGVIKDNTSTQAQQLTAYIELQKLYPSFLKNLTLQQYKTMDATTAQKELNKAIDQMTFSNLRSQLSMFDSKIADVQSRLTQLRTTPQLGVSGGTTSQYFSLQNQLKELQAGRQEYVVQINKVFDIQQKAVEKNNQKSKTQNKEYWSDIVKNAKDAIEKMPSSSFGSKEWKQQQSIIANANKELEKYSDSTKKLTTKTPEKITPFGTLEYWNEILNKLKDSITSYDSLTGKYIGTSFDEKGKPVKKGVDITSQLSNAESKIKSLTYVSLNDKTKELVKDSKENFDVFNNELEKIKDTAKNTTDYLEKLAEARILVMTGAFELTPEQQGQAVQIIDKASIESSRTSLDSLLDKYRTTKGKMLELEKNFNLEIEELNKALLNSKTIEEERQISDSIEARKKAFEKEKSGIKVEELVSSDDFNKLFSNLDSLTVNELIKLKAKIESQFSNLNLTPTDLKSLRDKINEVTSQIQQKNPFKALSEAIKTYKKDQNTLNLKDIFKSLSSSISMVSQSFDQITGSLDKLGIKTTEETDKVLKDISGIMQGSSNLAMGIATGNPMQIVQGSIDIILNGIDLIAGAGDRKLNTSIKQHQQNVDNLKESYNELEKSITKALGSQKYSEQQKLIENLVKQQQELLLMRNEESQKKKSDDAKIKEYYQSYKDISGQISDIIDKIRTDILGMDISNTVSQLGNAIIDAFSNGEDAAQAWGNKVDDIVGGVIRKMLIQKLVEQPVGNILQKYMNLWVDSNGNFLGFDEVMKTAQNMGLELKWFGDEFANTLSALPDDIKKYFTGTGIAGTTGTSNLTGAIQTVTQETASVISGQLNAMRITQAQGVEIMRSQLMRLSEISVNTYKLNDVVSILKVISTNNNRALGL